MHKPRLWCAGNGGRSKFDMVVMLQTKDGTAEG